MVYISLYSGDIFQSRGPFRHPDETENSVNSFLAREPENGDFFINDKKKGH